MSRAEFENFYKALDVDGNLAGLLGLGYLKLVKPGEEAAAEREIQNNYGLSRTIAPAAGVPWHAPVMLLEPAEEESKRYLGFDVAADPASRTAMEQTMADNKFTQAAGACSILYPAGRIRRPPWSRGS